MCWPFRWSNAEGWSPPARALQSRLNGRLQQCEAPRLAWLAQYCPRDQGALVGHIAQQPRQHTRYEIGRTAGELIRKRISGSQSSDEKVYRLEVDLIEGSTT